MPDISLICKDVVVLIHLIYRLPGLKRFDMFESIIKALTVATTAGE